MAEFNDAAHIICLWKRQLDRLNYHQRTSPPVGVIEGATRAVTLDGSLKKCLGADNPELNYKNPILLVSRKCWFNLK